MTGVILAGGKNTRMGKNKAFLEINGVRLIDRTIAVLQEIFDEIIIVANDPLSYLDYDATIAADILAGKGALGGLYTGLFFASSSHVFVCACDMPFINGSFIKYMVECTDDYDIVVPQSRDGLQPMHAIYGKKCLPVMLKRLERNDLKISDLYKGQKIRIIAGDIIDTFDPARRMFLNINTHSDLKQVMSA